MSDLFAYDYSNSKKSSRIPLAARMRPENIADILGQEEILGDKSLLKRAIEGDQLGSILLYGPPGTGKTSLAYAISKITKAYFVKLNAVTSGVNDIRKVINEAQERMYLQKQGTILFIDEIHRFNKAQQDALLPAVEDGSISLIGATTENPYFAINSPLLSRCRLFRLKPLESGHIVDILNKAICDKERGLGLYKITIDKNALEYLAEAARGDARLALNGLELAALSTLPDEQGIRRISIAAVEESIQQKAVLYDRMGDQHYDVISAFIKSMRGSDPDATLHYLARMLYAGEDPRAIMRRILIHAAEDVGLADPMALVLAQSAARAFEQVGMPEGRIILSQAALYIACAPKSNSVLAIDEAFNDVQQGKHGPVPAHLRDANYYGAQSLGHGKDYKYPHDYAEHFIEQQYLPNELEGVKYFKPSGNAHDTGVVKRWNKCEKKEKGCDRD